MSSHAVRLVLNRLRFKCQWSSELAAFVIARPRVLEVLEAIVTDIGGGGQRVSVRAKRARTALASCEVFLCPTVFVSML